MFGAHRIDLQAESVAVIVHAVDVNQAGKRQEFVVAPDAMRLYLATWDFYESNNNSGQRTVKGSRPEQVILVQ